MRSPRERICVSLWFTYSVIGIGVAALLLSLLKHYPIESADINITNYVTTSLIMAHIPLVLLFVHLTKQDIVDLVNTRLKTLGEVIFLFYVYFYFSLLILVGVANIYWSVTTSHRWLSVFGVYDLLIIVPAAVTLHQSIYHNDGQVFHHSINDYDYI
jgi:hypothetical protein